MRQVVRDRLRRRMETRDWKPIEMTDLDDKLCCTGAVAGRLNSLPRRADGSGSKPRRTVAAIIATAKGYYRYRKM